MRVAMNPDAFGFFVQGADDLLDELGGLITADAYRYAPKRSGRMAAGLSYEVQAGHLFVFSDAPYTLDVEFGHRVYHRFTGQVGPERVIEQPFLRPALYKYRSPGDPEGTPPLIAPGVTVQGRPRTLQQWMRSRAAVRGWRTRRRRVGG